MNSQTCEVRINELDEEQIYRLAAKIDKSKVNNTSIKLWYIIADEIVVHPYYRGILETLDINITDSENWINYLTQKYSEIGFERIVRISKDIGRYDVVNFLENIAYAGNKVKIGDLSQRERVNLAKLLQVNSRYQEKIDGWRAYAKHLYFTEEDFNGILQNKIFSCSSGRLLIFCQKIYPDTSLHNIRRICIRYKRFDVVKILENIANDIVNKRRMNCIIVDEIDYFSR